MNARALHPGTIVFVTDGRPPRLRAASAVPESIAFSSEGEPVLRVESHLVNERREVRSYGANHRLLQTTREMRPQTKR